MALLRLTVLTIFLPCWAWAHMPVATHLPNVTLLGPYQAGETQVLKDPAGRALRRDSAFCYLGGVIDIEDDGRSLPRFRVAVNDAGQWQLSVRGSPKSKAEVWCLKPDQAPDVPSPRMLQANAVVLALGTDHLMIVGSEDIKLPPDMGLRNDTSLHFELRASSRVAAALLRKDTNWSCAATGVGIDWTGEGAAAGDVPSVVLEIERADVLNRSNNTVRFVMRLRAEGGDAGYIMRRLSYTCGIAAT